MTGANGDEHDDRLPQLLAAYHAALTGQSPLPVNTADLERLDDTALDELRKAQLCLDLLEAARQEQVGGSGATAPDRDPTQRSPQPASGVPVVNPPHADSALSAFGRSTPSGRLLFGRFELLERLGEGGFGIVYLARDPMLGRNVALKVPQPQTLLSESARQRFLREARLVAKLRHPSLVAVHEAGEVGELCYIASDHCAGPSLTKHLKSSGGRLPARESARLAAEIAECLAYVHRQGIVHRDLKPSNILLEPNQANADAAAYQARITDFGIAKAVSEEADLTITGSILGTPQFMSPEQASGKLSAVGPASDIYSLGTILYAMLTGRPPIVGESDLDTLRKIDAEEPAPLRQLVRDVPPDLEAICLKCLEKQPAARYASAEELAKDLRRYLEGLPVTARRQARVIRAVKSLHKRQVSLRSLIPKLLLLAAAAVGVAWAWNRWQVQAVLDSSYLDDIHQAAHIWELASTRQRISRGADREMDERLGSHRPVMFGGDRRGFEWHYLWKLAHPAEFAPRYKLLRSFDGHTGMVFDVSFPPDQRQRVLFTAGEDKTARMWDIETGKVICAFLGHEDDVNRVEVSSDMRLVATASDDKTVRLWRPFTGEHVATLDAHRNWVADVSFSPDGKRLVSGDWDGQIKLWDVSGDDQFPEVRSTKWDRPGTGLGTPPEVQGVTCIRFSHDGKSILACAGAGIRILNAENLSLQSERSSAELGIQPAFAVFDHRDQSMAITGRDSNVTARAVIQSMSPVAPWIETMPAGQTRSIDFDAAGATVLMGWPSGEVIAFDIATHQTWNPLDAGYRLYWHVAHSPFGTMLAAAGGDGRVHVFDSREATRAETIMPQEIHWPAMAFDRTGRLQVFGMLDTNPGGPYKAESFHVWERGSVSATVDEGLISTPENTGVVGRVAFSPDGHFAAVSQRMDESLTIRVFDLQERRLSRSLEWPKFHVLTLRFTPDSSRLVATGFNRNDTIYAMRIWDVATGESQPALPDVRAKPNDHGLEISPDGTLLATVDEAKFVHVYDFPSLQLRYKLPFMPKDGLVLAFSNASDILAVGGSELATFDARTGRPLVSEFPIPFHRLAVPPPAIPGLPSVNHLVFSPDDSRIIGAHGQDPRPAIWNASNGEMLMQLPAARAFDVGITGLAISPNGREIAASVQGETHLGNVVVWSIPRDAAESSTNSASRP